MIISMDIKRGCIYWCDIPSYSTNILNKRRPCVIISNDINNKGSHTVNVLPLTSRIKKPELPCHVILDDGHMAKAEQILTIDRSWVINFVRELTWQEQKKVKISLLSQLEFI